jgi:hypothetical protein
MMTSFIRGEFEGTDQPWSDDPASSLVDRLEKELSDELEAGGPEYHPVRRNSGQVGRLVDEDDGALDDTTPEAIARSTYDDSELSAEEEALHYVDEDGEMDDPDMTPSVKESLEDFD